MAASSWSPTGSSPLAAPCPAGRSRHVEDLVYVANAGAVGPDFSGFKLNNDGRLRPLDGSTVSLPDGSQPGDVLFNSTGTSLVGTLVGTSEIDSFVVGEHGRLTPGPISLLCSGALGPFGSEFRPTNPHQAVRLQRPQRRRGHRDGVGLPRRRRRGPLLDRIISVPGQRDGGVLD